MKSVILAATALLAAAAPAAAQGVPGAEVYGGLSAGYHGVGDLDLTAFGASDVTDIDGAIYGAFVGARTDVGNGLQLGAEGNFHFGSGSIDNEYGIAATVGTSLGNGSSVFLRGGYQWVDLDIDEVAEDLADDLNLSGADANDLRDALVAGIGDDDTVDGWLVGVGTDVAVGQNSMLRLAADTIEFDTVRLTAGFGFKF